MWERQRKNDQQTCVGKNVITNNVHVEYSKYDDDYDYCYYSCVSYSYY